MAGNQNSPDWRTGMVERYAALFDVLIDGRLLAPGSPTCGDGWRDLVERTVGRIAEALLAAPSGSQLSIVQIKEKFGCLRLYYSGTGLDGATMAAVEEAVALGEARSGCTCEVCGEAGRLREWKGWFATSCDAHAKGEPVALKAGRENLHITRSLKDGTIRIDTCRRYDRDKDSFTDVDPATLGIEK